VRVARGSTTRYDRRMWLRFVVSCAVLAGCKDPPQASPPPPERKPTTEVRRPTVAEPQRQRQTPALPTPSIVNPPGVPYLSAPVETDRGVQYVDEVVGTGPMPEKGKLVKVHYTGWLPDGTAFDSSHDRDQPIAIRFDNGQVIKGWDIGLASMRVGGKRRLIIPAELGYGTSGHGEVIPPDSVLIFDVELVEME
jgi:peptidylprolyl isomerase